jgi:hypothetical protein
MRAIMATFVKLKAVFCRRLDTLKRESKTIP